VTVAAVVLDEPPAPRRRSGPAPRRGAPAASDRGAAVIAAALGSGLEETIAVIGDERRASALPEGATVLLDASIGAAGRVRSAIDWCARQGHDAIVLALPGPPGAALDETVLDKASWAALGNPAAKPIAVLMSSDHRRTRLVRIDAEAWPLVPLEGSLSSLLTARSELVAEVTAESAGPGPPVAAESGTAPPVPSPGDVAAVAELLGRPPAGDFAVVVRDRSGAPVVIRNAPFLFDGTPMPTRYWLTGRAEREAVGRFESTGGVRRASAAVDPGEIADAHARYAAERDAEIAPGYEGPRPSGGVGGTRTGVKCLHAHLAWYLAGGHDPVGRWVAGELSGVLEGPVGAVDCGTNSTRLLISGRDGETLERRMTITRLGEGVDDTGSLGDPAIERTLAALAEYRGLLDDHGVVAVRAAATSAARDADNAEVFFSRAESVLGVRPELLTGEEEGRLSYAGATSGLDPASGPYLVVDLGGGSTELVAPAEGSASAVAVVSLDVGCVRITERFLKGDPPSSGEISAARSFVGAAVDAALDRVPELSVPRQMIGVAGTVSTLVSLALGLDHYDPARLHHQTMQRTTVERLAAELVAQRSAERAARPGIEAGRADVIAGGALVLAEAMVHLGHERLIYSESDILDGLAADLLARQR